MFQNMAHSSYLFPEREGHLWSLAHFWMNFWVSCSLRLESVPLGDGSEPPGCPALRPGNSHQDLPMCASSQRHPVLPSPGKAIKAVQIWARGKWSTQLVPSFRYKTSLPRGRLAGMGPDTFCPDFTSIAQVSPSIHVKIYPHSLGLVHTAMALRVQKDVF